MLLCWGQCRGPGYGLGSGEVTPPTLGTVRGGGHIPWGPAGHSAEGSLTSASPNLPTRPDRMSPALPRRGVRSPARATPRPSPTPPGLPRGKDVPRSSSCCCVSASSDVSEKSERREASPWDQCPLCWGRGGGGSRTVTPLTPAPSRETVWPWPGGQEGHQPRSQVFQDAPPTPAGLHPP